MGREIRRSALWSDPKVKPPFGAVEIDWGHPLAGGLASAFLFNEDGGYCHDMATGLRNRDIVVTRSGIGGRFYDTQASPALLEADGASAFADIGALDFSVVVDFYIASGELTKHLVEKIDSNISTGWLVRFNGTSLQCETGPPATFTFSNQGTMTAGTLNRTVTARHTTSVKMYISGIEATYSLVGSHPDPGSTPNTYQIGVPTAPAVGIDRVMFYRGRTLSQADAAWLNVEPYCFLRPIIRRRYFIPPPPPFLRGTLFDDAWDPVPLYAGR